MPQNAPPYPPEVPDLPLGELLTDWTPPPPPPKRDLAGEYCTLQPLRVERHSAALFAANGEDRTQQIWAYLPYGPFADLAAYQAWMRATCLGDDPLFFAVVEHERERAVGIASYLNINPAAGSIEVGHINYAPPLQRTRAATEAMYLMMRYAFELGYRRYEWKCNALNQKSRSAALRLGFRFEGIFRQMMVVKGRNRDTAWYSVLDKEWRGGVREAMETWLGGDNFDAAGQQKQGLGELMGGAGGGGE